MKQLALILMVLLTMACASNSPATLDDGSPAWTLNPPKDDVKLYGVGESILQQAGRAKKQATTQARAQIASSISTAIQSAVTDYFQEGGSETSEAVAFYEEVIRETTNETLRGSIVESVYFNEKTKTHYVLVSLPIANIEENALASFNRNEESAFAEFKADEALEKLQMELGE